MDDNTQPTVPQDDQSTVDKVTNAIPGDIDDKVVAAVGDMAGKVGDMSDKAGDMAGGAVDKVTDMIPGEVDDKIIDAVGDAASKVGDAAGAVGGAVAGLNPFGDSGDAASDDAADENKVA